MSAQEGIWVYHLLMWRIQRLVGALISTTSQWSLGSLPLTRLYWTDLFSIQMVTVVMVAVAMAMAMAMVCWWRSQYGNGVTTMVVVPAP
jgi:hypothetical protein